MKDCMLFLRYLRDPIYRAILNLPPFQETSLANPSGWFVFSVGKVRKAEKALLIAFWYSYTIHMPA